MDRTSLCKKSQEVPWKYAVVPCSLKSPRRYHGNTATHILGSRLFEGPQLPKKGFQKAPDRRKTKSSQFDQQVTYWEAVFLKGSNSRKKASKRPPGRPRTKSGQFYQQLTYWEAAFLKAPTSRHQHSGCSKTSLTL